MAAPQCEAALSAVANVTSEMDFASLPSGHLSHDKSSARITNAYKGAINELEI